MSTKKTVHTVRLGNELRNRIHKICERYDESFAVVSRRLLREAVEMEEARNAVNQVNTERVQ